MFLCRVRVTTTAYLENMPKRKFRDAWLHDEGFREWIRKVDDDDSKAYCAVCECTMVTEITTIKRHQTCRRHTQALAQRAAPADQPPPGVRDDDVTRAEIKLAAFLAEHNISINTIDHLTLLLKDIFPDSAIAAKLSLKRTKATRILHDISQVAQEQLHRVMRDNKFSIIIDETTDISTCKSCAVVVKLFNKVSGKIETKFLDLLPVYDTINMPSTSHDEATGSTGEHLFQLLTSYFNKHAIPLENLIGFAADGASNIMGVHNSLCSRLRVVAPGVTILKCTCHSLHLCASQAAKTLPRMCEDLIRNIYTYFSHSAKRVNEFKEFQSFCEVKPHKLLHAAQTRWLSLEMAVNRVVEQWQPLKLYFSQKHLEDRLSVSSTIYESLNDPSVLLYFHFLSFILPKFTKVNLIFQKAEPTIHRLYDTCMTLIKDILRCYMKQEIISCTSDITLIDPSDEKHFLPLENIYLGVDVHRLLQSPEHRGNTDMIRHVRNRCRMFLITACLELKKRLPFGSKLLEMCSRFSVGKCVNLNILSSTPSVLDLVTELPRVYQGNKQELDDEWRSLPNLDVPENVKCQNNPEVYFKWLLDLKNEEGTPSFNLLPLFALNILALPTSNADAERIFSKVGLNKTKIRNKLSLPTQAALVIISEKSNEGGGCIGFNPSQDMIRCVQHQGDM